MDQRDEHVVSTVFSDEDNMMDDDQPDQNVLNKISFCNFEVTPVAHSDL